MNPKKNTICECKEGKCALSLIYPNSDNATYACDEKCYFSYCDNKARDWYIKNHPEEMKKCGCIKNEPNATPGL